MCWEDVFTEDVDNACCRVTKTVTYPGASKKAVVSDAAKTKPSLRIIPLRKSGSLNAVEKEEQICLGGDKLLSYSSYKRMYENVFEKLGIKGRYINYDFRSTYATELWEAGLDFQAGWRPDGAFRLPHGRQVCVRSRQESVMKQLPYLNALCQAYEN